MDILLIEDNAVDQAIVENYVLQAFPDANIDLAETGKDALRLLQNKKFNFALIDYRLPDMNGIDILKKIYNPQTDLPPCPCVVLTGENSNSLFREAMKYGAQDYLKKINISPEVLSLAIEKAKYLYNIKVEKNDISEKYAQAQKIEAIGKLTGGIAHDFNNLLTVILGNTRLLQYASKEENPDKEYCQTKLNSIENAAQKGADLVKHLMTFSRQRRVNPKPVNINTILRNMHDLLSRTIGTTVTITNDVSSDLWNVYADPSELEHLLINMCANARDAMPDGGKVTIKTQNIILDAKTAKRHQLSKGEYVCLTITDTGQGIDSAIINKIFDPFFTTKDVGKGSGLGISTSYNFVRDCGGTIIASSTLGEGAIFDIYFPRCQQEEAPQENVIQYQEHKDISATILITEDEDEIRSIAASILKEKGFIVLEACNASEALRVMQNNEIDILFTDIVMPGDINGVQLAARALVLQPNLKVLFTTGFIKTAIPDMNLLEEFTVLNKPYNPDKLLSEIYKILEGHNE